MGGGATGGCTGGAVGATGGVVAAAVGGCADGGTGTVNVGLGVVVGTTILGGGTAAGGGGGGVLTGEPDGAAGVTLTGGRAAGADAATGACCLRIAFRTSPGREILDRSILVLISSPSARLERVCFGADWASLVARR